MKKLSPAKKQQLILTIVGTLALISLVYCFLISPQNETNKKLKAEANEKYNKIQEIKKLVRQKEDTQAKAAQITADLEQTETDIASGDLFAWTYDTIRRFKTNYRIEIPNIGQPIQSDVEMIPNFPYKQIKFVIGGTGYYYDIGKFISDLENKYPHIRVSNLSLEPSFNDAGTEKLAFQMEVLALVKPNS